MLKENKQNQQETNTTQNSTKKHSWVRQCAEPGVPGFQPGESEYPEYPGYYPEYSGNSWATATCLWVVYKYPSYPFTLSLSLAYFEPEQAKP